MWDLTVSIIELTAYYRKIKHDMAEILNYRNYKQICQLHINNVNLPFHHI